MPSAPSDGGSNGSRGVGEWLRATHLWQIQPVRDLILVASIVGLAWLGHRLSTVTVPLLIGLLVAYLFEPLVQWLTRFRWCPRPVAALGIVVVVCGGLLLAVALALPLLVGQAVSLVERVRSGAVEARVMELIERLPDQYQSDARRGAGWIFGVHAPGHDAGQDRSAPTSSEEPDATTAPEESPGGGETAAPATIEPAIPPREVVEVVPAPSLPAAASPRWSILDLAGSGLRTAWSAIVGLLTVSLAIVLIPFYFYYFSISYPRTLEFLGDLVPEANRPRVFELVRKMDRAVAGFVRGRIVISAIMGAMLAVGWLIVGVPYAILLGLVTGVFCLVPYLGGVGLPIAIGLLALDQAGLAEDARMSWIAVIVAPSVVFLIVQVVEGYLLTPVIAGRATDLSVLAIFVAVLAGGALAGVYGMLLAIPVAACLKIVLVEVVQPRIRAWTRGEASDPLPMD